MAGVFFKNYFIERYPDFEEVFFIELVMAIVLDERINYKLKVLLEDLIVNMLEWIEQGKVYLKGRKRGSNNRLHLKCVFHFTTGFGERLSRHGEESFK
jgi:hypothetical protein